MFQGIKQSLTKHNASSEIIPANVFMSLLHCGYMKHTTLHCKPGLYLNSHLTPVCRMRLS
jgi:hypothetical protein